MSTNRSPWLHQLDKERVPDLLTRDIETDIAIVGAGIAGISTAFFLLKNTNRTVVVLERGRLAHGATGHNAGQVVSYFECGFANLEERFGLTLAAAGQKSVEDAWELIDEMYVDAGLDIPFSRFLGHAGLTSLAQVLLHLRNNDGRVRGGLNGERIWIAQDCGFLDQIPAKFAPLYDVVPRSEVLDALETQVSDYVAVVSYQKGVVNSALFCQEVVSYLKRKYADRFALYEHAAIDKIILRADHGVLDAGTHEIRAQRVVLCTNGFENLNVINQGGLEVNTRFHELVRGTVGYMSGYLEPMNKQPAAISYLDNPDPSTDNAYFYLTRRPYEYESDAEMNLISIGGPGFDIEDTRSYRMDHDFPDEVNGAIDSFVRTTYDPEPNKQIDYQFSWHGLMGYTKNGVRLVGTEPKNPVLLYNLGCNGIGILPSVYGGKRITDLINGLNTGPTIFDIPPTLV